MKHPFLGISALFLLAALLFLAGCATEGGYQGQRYEPGNDQYTPASGGAIIGPPPGAG